ncbi:hypothetical protein ACFVP0_30505 [Streptomyces cinereoruber]|uniref:hypothetical protein n=1 Tax=Streptomyces cinereoruber TaxID=67260 RepID=UPI00369FD79E
MFGRRKAKKDAAGLGPAGVPWLAHEAPAWPQTPQPTQNQDSAAPVADDFLPSALQLDHSVGRFMSWQNPLVLDGEVRKCPHPDSEGSQCEAYRGWIVLAYRGEVWLRCPQGHETLEARLDIAWYNRNSGPSDARFGSLEEGLDHFGL